MATKTYYVKASWRDPNQPLARIYVNDTVVVDLAIEAWEITETVKRTVCDRRVYYEDFCVDFMIEAGGE